MHITPESEWISESYVTLREKKNEKNSRSVPWNACITQKCNWKMQVTQKKQHLQLHSMQSLKQSDHFPCTFSYRANGEFEFELASNCFASSIIFDDGSGFCITLTHQIISQSIPFSSYHYDVICVYTFSCCAAALVFTSIFLLSQSMDTKITTSDTDTHTHTWIEQQSIAKFPFCLIHSLYSLLFHTNSGTTKVCIQIWCQRLPYRWC